MSNQITVNENLPVSQEQIISNLVLHGDLSRLAPVQKVQYYNAICDRIGLDPLTQPFKLLNLSGKQIMYCDRSGAQQLNKLYEVSHRITAREIIQDCYLVTAQAFLPTGRQTESIGAVSLIYPETKKDNGRTVPHPKANQPMIGDDLCNALMKAETKAKRRSTLDLLGLGMLDESEIETIPNAQTVPIPVSAESDPAPEERNPTLTPKQKSFIEKLIVSGVFTEEEREKTAVFLADPDTTPKKASKMIERLQELIQERKAEEKLTEKKRIICRDCEAVLISEERKAGAKGWCCFSDIENKSLFWRCKDCMTPKPKPQPEGSPEELRRKAEAIKESALKAEGQDYYKEMAEAQRLFAIADQKEREQQKTDKINE